MKKIIAFVLLTLMCLSAVVGCNSTQPKETSNPSTTDTAFVNNSWYPDDGPIYLPNEKFDGYTFTVLVTGNPCNKFNDFSNENSENYSLVNDAITKRNATVEERYGIEIELITDMSLSWGDGNSTGFKRIGADFASDDCNYDLCAVGSFDAPKMAMNDYLLDLTTVEHIDLSRAWWDASITRDLSVGGKTFYATGEIGISDNIATHAILFNKDIAQEKKITDLYTLVEEGKWTVDKFTEYCKKVTWDVDGNDKMDHNDQYGLMSWNDALQASLAGAHLKFCSVNEDKELELTLYNEKSADLVDKITKLVFDRTYSFNYVNRSPKAWQTYMVEMFMNNQGLFFTTYLATVPELRDSKTDFGILPYPKYNEDQSEYGSFVPATYGLMYCIESTCDDVHRTGIIVEALAYESMINVTPAFYDNTLIGRYVRDDESAVCLDRIFAGHSYDLGIYCTIGGLTGKLTDMMKIEKNNFTSIYESNRDASLTAIEQINQLFCEQ